MSGNKNNAGLTRFQFSLRKTRGHFQIGGEGALFVFDHFFANITIVDLLLHTFQLLIMCCTHQNCYSFLTQLLQVWEMLRRILIFTTLLPPLEAGLLDIVKA